MNYRAQKTVGYRTITGDTIGRCQRKVNYRTMHQSFAEFSDGTLFKMPLSLMLGDISHISFKSGCYISNLRIDYLLE
uniref:Uncharacterized protein n=1 Tax=Romanomermis culicivorax TaxID=13658 RepID=A0A915K896_ROMCU